MNIRERANSIPGVMRVAGVLQVFEGFMRGFRFAWRFAVAETLPSGGVEGPPEPNPLEDYFDNHLEGPGILKWRHYFPIYHRHFAKFRDSEVHVVEIGVFSGGSLEMWRYYFGDRCHIYGVDLDEACKVYERDGVQIFIGDQADPAFWQEFLRSVPTIDIVIDDGGHRMHQQIATLEALLPALAPGGVYLCEDVHGTLNGFQGYVNGMLQNLNKWAPPASHFQQAVRSVHSYPFVTVIELSAADGVTFAALQHGTEWLH
jgi:23S rRNA U2552 (ribose-2'-O)-methylase RlmE/FtsJ